MVDRLRLSGGRRGTAACLAGLWSAAATLDQLAESVARSARDLRTVLDGGVLVPAMAVAPVAGARAAWAAAACLGPAGPAAASVELTELAIALRGAVLGYRVTEEGTERALSGLAWWAGRTGAWLPVATGVAVLGSMAAVRGPGTAWSRAAVGSPAGAALVRTTVAAAPDVAAAVVTRPPGSMTVRSVAAVGLGVARPVGLLRDTEVVPRPAVPGVRPAQAARGVADLLVGTDATARVRPPGTGPSAAPGTVRVVEVRRSTGSTWIVQIPGTQAWSPRPGPGDSPFDLAGALALTAGESSSGARLASAALAEAGAAPDEPVLLVGHSQGGMIAAQMAGDPAVRDRFRITHVITAGSPVGVAAIPEDVRVLSLEHDDDLVPHLDGRPNPDRGTWITVHAASPHGASGPLPPHDSQGYVVTARAVDASPDPDLVEYRCGLRPFLDGPGVSVISTDMRAVRTGG